MADILFPLLVISIGIIYIIGHKKKWKAFVDPEKYSANIFESAHYTSKWLVGDDVYKWGSYVGGVMTILFGIALLVLFNI